jgi:hypothetical protein
VDYSPTTRDADRKDFDLFLVEANLLPETVRQISEFNADLSFLDDAPVTVAESVIDGKGLFLTEPKCGDELMTLPTPPPKHLGEHQKRPSQSSAGSTTLTAQTRRRTLRLALARSIG